MSEVTKSVIEVNQHRLRDANSRFLRLVELDCPRCERKDIYVVELTTREGADCLKCNEVVAHPMIVQQSCQILESAL
jgi:ribosomal protein S27E